MYRPGAFAMDDIDLVRGLIAARPLATVVTFGDDGLDAEHVPLIHRTPIPPDDGAPLGRLVGHVARANPLVASPLAARPALAVFHGPDAYVTPTWYPTKAETGKAVPTWNYEVVHVHGTLRIIDDPAWLREQVAELTRSRETGRSPAWSVDDAPSGYMEAMIRGIVGIEIVVTRMIGKRKMSQNQPERNRRGVAEGMSREAAGEGGFTGPWDREVARTIARGD